VRSDIFHKRNAYIVEQDHRGVKRRMRPMLGLKNVAHAAITIAGAQHRERAVAEAGLLLSQARSTQILFFLPPANFAQAHARANGPGTNAKTALCSFCATSTSRLATARSL
jgi:hypothetical protein